VTGGTVPSRDGIVAESLVTVAFAVQIVLTLGTLVVSAYLAYFGVTVFGSPNIATYAGALGVISLILLAVAYYRSYGPTREGNYLDAATPTLILGIIFCLLLVTLLIGVLYLFAYSRLADANAENQETPESLTRCLHCSAPLRPTDIICGRCGKSRWAADP